MQKRRSFALTTLRFLTEKRQHVLGDESRPQYGIRRTRASGAGRIRTPDFWFWSHAGQRSGSALLSQIRLLVTTRATRVSHTMEV
jgi:hypothetical protein